MEQENKNLQIPFVKPARVGNFKLWRSKTSLSYAPTDEDRAKVREESGGKKKAVTRKVDIEVINISSLDGSWKVQIPQTSTLFSVIANGYATTDENIREQFLAGEVFANLEAINTCGSVVLHHSFRLLFDALSYPMLFMTEKELTSWVKKNFEAGDKNQMKQHLENLLKERKEFYEMVEKERKEYLSTWEEQRKRMKNEEENALKRLEQDEIAEEAMKILSKKDE